MVPNLVNVLKSVGCDFCSEKWNAEFSDCVTKYYFGVFSKVTLLLGVTELVSLLCGEVER